MGSIWSNVAIPGTPSGASPFAVSGMAPSPGGAKVAWAVSSSGLPAGLPGGTAMSVGAGKAAPVASSGSSSSSSSSTNDAGSITSNDFLTLLVTEMQNQDPTADTDPNAYIDQLVQINSLEQLISINQNLATVLGDASQSSPATGASASGTASSVSQNPEANASHPQSAAAESVVRAGRDAAGSIASGNLSLPGGSSAAHTMAHSLGGHVGAMVGHGIRDIPTH